MEIIAATGMEALRTVFFLAAPMLGAALVAGLSISILQSVTSINEMTLTFIPKIGAVGCALAFFAPYMANRLREFTIFIFENIPNLIRQ